MMFRKPMLLLAVMVLAAAPLTAQTPTAPLQHPAIARAMELMRADNAWTVDQQSSLCEIPAPPFKEAVRAEEYRRRLAAFGLQNVRIDTEGNVIADRPGTGGGPRVLISAHLDTVFPEETDVTVTRTGTRLDGPGISDDCRGLTVLLQLAKAMHAAGVQTTGDIIFVGTVGEEGPGNLRGVRHLFDAQSAGRIDYFISVDGSGFGVTSGAVGSHRYTVTYEGPGGHSYGAFGMPNPIHALGRAMAKFADFQVPATPRTTFNVGVISGGTSVNSIAFSASMDVDMRSESQEELDRLDAQLRSALEEARQEEIARWPNSQRPLELKIEEIGKRPAGQQPDTAHIVRTALAAAAALGQSPRPGASSTDSNIPISLGVPAVTIRGGGRAGDAHSLNEWYDDGPDGWLGPQNALLLVVMLAGLAPQP
ncbi:MAG: M20/M25/M40 family metallo-hydrolase [Gemmatimonadales bacterium]